MVGPEGGQRFGGGCLRGSGDGDGSAEPGAVGAAGCGAGKAEGAEGRGELPAENGVKGCGEGRWVSGPGPSSQEGLGGWASASVAGGTR